MGECVQGTRHQSAGEPHWSREVLGPGVTIMPNYGHHRSDRIHEILNPASGIRDDQLRKGIKPRDHARDNVLRIRAMQKLISERKAAVATTAAALATKTSKYESVGSRVTAQLSRPTSAAERPATPRTAELRNFACPKPSGAPGRAFTAWEPPPLLYEGMSDVYGSGTRREKLKPAVPLREPPKPRPPSVDFVKRNTALSSLTPKRTPTVPASPPGTNEKSKYHGRMPPYLLDRKLELANAAAKAEAAATPRECPEGTHVLPDEERLEVLTFVKKGKEKVHAELDKMPFVVDTFGLKLKHEILTKQLAQLEAADAAFSRPKVVVQDDAPSTPPSSPAKHLMPARRAALPIIADLTHALAEETTALAGEVSRGEEAVDVTDF